MTWLPPLRPTPMLSIRSITKKLVTYKKATQTFILFQWCTFMATEIFSFVGLRSVPVILSTGRWVTLHLQTLKGEGGRTKFDRLIHIPVASSHPFSSAFWHLRRSILASTEVGKTGHYWMVAQVSPSRWRKILTNSEITATTNGSKRTQTAMGVSRFGRSSTRETMEGKRLVRAHSLEFRNLILVCLGQKMVGCSKAITLAVKWSFCCDGLFRIPSTWRYLAGGI